MGQCCRKDSSQGPEVEQENSKKPPVTIRNVKGLLYDEFSDLIMTQYGSGDVQTPNTSHPDPHEAWQYTARLLDEGKRGFLLWEDIDTKVSDLAREWDQATIIADIIETLTRSRVKLRHVFIALDTDGGGRLCQSEFFQGLSLLQGSKDHVEIFEAKLLWNMLDQNKDGDISREEFMTGLSVEDTWKVVEQDAAKRKSIHLIFDMPTSCEPKEPVATLQEIADERGVDLQTAAASRIQRFYRSLRAQRMMLAKVWQVTLHALDLQDEMEINSDDDGSLDPSVDSNEDVNEAEETEEDTAEVSKQQGITLNLPDIIAMLRRRELPPRAIASALICRVSRIHREAPNVGCIDVPENGQLIIVGDIHGQLDDLMLILDEGGLPPQTTFLFNGDFVDRGIYGVEVLLLIYALKLSWPDHVFMNRGNHEAKRLNEKYGFDEEVAFKYDLDLFRTITKSFCMLPLAHVVAKQFFVVHGGLSTEENVTLEEFNKIDRFKQIPKKADAKHGQKWRLTRIFEGAVWSDPRDIPTWEESKRGAGIHFGKNTVEEFLETNNLKKLIRSHESFQPGYAEHHDRLTITVFSASNYCGTDENMGCFLVVRPTLEIQYRQYRISGDADRLRKHVQKAVNNKPRDTNGDAEHDAMSRIRMLVFCKRSELLHAFQECDEKKVGKVHVEGWIKAMQRCINEQVPWRIIRRSLTPMERDGMIAYVPFLQRYQNRLQQKWSIDWAEKMMLYLGCRMRRFVENIIAMKSGKVLSYYEMCDNLRTFIPGLGESASYHIVIAMDSNRDGFIDVDEFIKAFKLTDGEGARPEDDFGNDKSCIIELWEMYSFDQIAYSMLKRAFLKLAAQKKMERSIDNLPQSKEGWTAVA